MEKMTVNVTVCVCVCVCSEDVYEEIGRYFCKYETKSKYTICCPVLANSHNICIYCHKAKTAWARLNSRFLKNRRVHVCNLLHVFARWFIPEVICGAPDVGGVTAEHPSTNWESPAPRRSCGKGADAVFRSRLFALHPSCVCVCVCVCVGGGGLKKTPSIQIVMRLTEQQAHGIWLFY